MGHLSRYVITGGPGSGKSTLLSALQHQGYHCSAEVSRRMIMEQVKLGTNCLPWQDIECFSAKVLHEMELEWALTATHQFSFFDRGIPDVIAYLQLANLPVHKRYQESAMAHPYCHQVFILPPWKDIYVNDPERWQSYSEAVAIHQMLVNTYTAYGYALTEVPALPVEQRTDFILSQIK